jgi:hypothetical protein
MQSARLAAEFRKKGGVSAPPKFMREPDGSSRKSGYLVFGCIAPTWTQEAQDFPSFSAAL